MGGGRRGSMRIPAPGRRGEGGAKAGKKVGVAKPVNRVRLGRSPLRMKPPVLLAVVLGAAPLLAAADVVVGETAGAVHAALGDPTGQVRQGARQVLYYAHGSVELTDGRVTRVDLRTPAEQAAVEAREARLRADVEARRRRLIEEGTALRDRKLADAGFLAAPLSYQVGFWEDFARRYPGVSCAEPLAIARVKLGEELEEKRRREEESERLARIEEQLAAAARGPQTRYVYRGRHGRHQEFALWPVSYTYFDAPLPAYTSPTLPLAPVERSGMVKPSSRRDEGASSHGHHRRTGAGHREPPRGRM